MVNNRVIVQLLIKDGKLIKTRRFGESKYIGDPLNAIKIFNDKAVDELVITDMTATKKGLLVLIPKFFGKNLFGFI